MFCAGSCLRSTQTSALTRRVQGSTALKTPRRSFISRPMAAMKAYVKGKPDTNTLLDCPFCHRVLLTCEVKKVPYEREYVDFANKPAWLQERSGGKVPVINEGDFWLADSDKIVVHLEEKYPEPSMVSKVPSDIGGNFFPLFKGWLFPDEGQEQENKQKFLQVFKQVNDYLAGRTGRFFGGDHLDATDAALAPKIYHAVVALGHYRGLSMDEYPAIAKYMDAIKQLPEWKACDYGEQAIIDSWSHKH